MSDLYSLRMPVKREFETPSEASVVYLSKKLHPHWLVGSSVIDISEIVCFIFELK